jgi:GNAT superfamily N-acetyltransferase
MNVLVLAKVLQGRPDSPRVETVEVARIDVVAAPAEWLTLRERAFRDETPPVRPWRRADIAREFASGSRGPERVTWLARDAHARPPVSCGAVSVSLPQEATRPASLHWLMVDPDYRGRGIGSALLTTAERHCWERGCREIRLETHRGWEAAVQFYEQHGYQPDRR